MGTIAPALDQSAIDLLHLDVMDGRFVPNLTFGPGYIKNLAAHTSIPLDAHLMIEQPEGSIVAYLELNLQVITIHYEATRFPARLLSLIRQEGAVAGLAINPATPVNAVYDLLPYADLILVMSVDPGFYGQNFMPEATNRVKQLADFAKSQGLKNLLIQADGGINNANAEDIVLAGANLLVAGGAVFGGKNAQDVNRRAAELKYAANKHLRL